MRQTRYVFAFVMLSAFVLLMIVLNTVTGSVKIPLAEIAKLLVGRGTDGTAQSIVWQIRLPRAVAAAVLGGALALSGYLLQTFFHNPIAGPFVLGIS
ncbi:MAG: iron ABC transporter permease, partial [Lachnospiraceae bacterium]|nr:iron ABC transporter permease [Lachnospiraceae bacterium]